MLYFNDYTYYLNSLHHGRSIETFLIIGTNNQIATAGFSHSYALKRFHLEGNGIRMGRMGTATECKRYNPNRTIHNGKN